MDDPQDNEQPGKPSDKPSIKQLIGSTLAAGIGVQSDKNRERDFKGGNIKTFIICGVIFTVLFVVGLIALVNLVLD